MSAFIPPIAEALSHMHKHHIAYRDLKPDNCLIDKTGYCVLIDLGFTKIVQDKTFTMCGTPGYVAPEQLKSGNRGAWGKNGHNQMVDWWSWAVVLYELLSNSTPFQCPGMHDYDTQDAIMIADYACPDYFPDMAKDIIDKLLVVDVTQQLGYSDEPGTTKYQKILEHPWFALVELHFDKLRNKQLTAPWIPPLKNDSDASQLKKPVWTSRG
jgi:protein kinase A